jgi:two-component system cell cycle sensor histidine kinase/response regulator CckA
VLQPRVLDTVRLVRSMETMLPRLIGEDIELVTTLDPGTGNIRADAGQMEQVVLNLALNARDAMPGGGRLSIETSNCLFDAGHVRAHPEMKAGAYVRVVVRDTGVGMDAHTVSHLYEPFFTTKEPGKGTGLGLSTVYGIISQSEGHIELESAPGHGTTFRIYLPRADQPTDTVEPVPADRELMTGLETILLVEDEEMVRELARDVLRVAGYTVLEAASGPDALRLLEGRQEPLHLLLSDVILPQMNGCELYERLVSERPDLKVLYMSGYTDDVFARHGRVNPSSSFIQKPFTLAALTARVRQVLDEPLARVA